MKQENEEEAQALRKKHEEELQRWEEESVASTGVGRTRDLIELDRDEGEEAKKGEELRKQIEGSDDPALRAQLVRQLEEHEEAVRMRLQREHDSQKAGLEEKLAERKRKKLERKRAIQARQDSERRDLQEKSMADEEKARLESGDSELQ